MKNTSSLNNGDDYSDDFPLATPTGAEICEKITVPFASAGSRLDAALAALFPEMSRSRLAALIKTGNITVDGKASMPRQKLSGGESILLKYTPENENADAAAEEIPLNIVYEDDAVLVIDKPAGLVVHPGAGNRTGTLLNGLLHYLPALQHIPRAGIVHRLDKETSGLLVIAKTPAAQTLLVRQLQARSVKRVYRAVADGIVPYDGKIETQIGRDPHNRLKMAVLPFGGKEAVTHVRVLERYDNYSYIECSLETGRTHQIRVHMQKAGHPLAGDPVYGNLRHTASDDVKDAVRALGRQALHAFRLSFVHPVSNETVSFEAPLPADMYRLLSVLRFEAGMDSSLKQEEIRTPYTAEEIGFADDDDDDDDGDYDIDVIYVRD